MSRKLTNGCVYHVFNKSISSYGIFQKKANAQRFLMALDYYNNRVLATNLAMALKRKKSRYANLLDLPSDPVVKHLCYCIMPDHYHLLIKVIDANLISKYMNDIENSYSRFFNIKNKRKGPLWQSAYKLRLIKSDMDLLYIGRYIHLNPTSAGLVNSPLDYELSSYRDYVIGSYLLANKEFSIGSKGGFKRFTENYIDYQRKLKLIRKKVFE